MIMSAKIGEGVVMAYFSYCSYIFVLNSRYPIDIRIRYFLVGLGKH